MYLYGAGVAFLAYMVPVLPFLPYWLRSQ